jgi:hypothetical protein
MIAQANSVSTQRLWGQIVARAWSDEEFKQRLIDDPRSVLAEHGIELPGGADLKILEDTDDMRHFVLPPPPDDDMSEEPLTGDIVAWCYSGYCGRCGCGCGRCRC